MKCCTNAAIWDHLPALPAPPTEIETSSLLFGFIYKKEKVWGSCPDENGVIQGFTYQVDDTLSSTTDDIHTVHCINGPPLRSGSTCTELDWKKTFDREMRWAKCATGYFLKAIYRNNGKTLRYLDKGVCCKPNSQPIEEVYTTHDCQEKHGMFARSGTYKCPANFALAGLQRNDGDLGLLTMHSLSTFWCCPFKRTPPTPVTPVTNVDDVTDGSAKAHSNSQEPLHNKALSRSSADHSPSPNHHKEKKQ